MTTRNDSTTSSSSEPNSAALEEADRLLSEAIEAQQIANAKREAAAEALRALGRPMPLFDRIEQRKD